MKFLPGNAGGPGRPTGSRNTLNEVRDYLESHDINAIGLFLTEWKKVRDKSSEKAAYLMLDFMEYVYPKQKSLDVTITEEQALNKLREVIDIAGQDIPIPDRLLSSNQTTEEP